MTTILLVIHLLIALALVGVILLQRSEGGALGIGGGGGGGGGGGFGGLMSGRASAEPSDPDHGVLGGRLHRDQPDARHSGQQPLGADLDPGSAGRRRPCCDRTARPSRKFPPNPQRPPGD